MESEKSHPAKVREADFRFYEELNDFLPEEKRKRAFTYAFTGTPAVRDAIQAIGVPHTEVDLVLVDGESVGFGHRLSGGERVTVYPAFERLDISPLNRLRSAPLRDTKFILDVHLGRLARYMRMLGFDAAYRNDFSDTQIIETSLADRRIILTRDLGILKNGSVTHGYWLRRTDPNEQAKEVIDQFDLRSQIRPFTRCMACNGILADVSAGAVKEQVPPDVFQQFDSFRQCERCKNVHWPGSHYDRMRKWIEEVFGVAGVERQT